MNNTIREALATEAAKHGFTLDKADLRCGLFFLKRGTEVRSLGSVGRIRECMIPYYVDFAVRHGNRIDHIKGSRYFAGEA